MSIDISVVIPTYNERDNVVPIIESVGRVLHELSWEIIFVDDDSPDGTADLVKQLSHDDARIRCIRRVNRRGLNSAIIEGVLASSATCVAVMDADMQHDESLLESMYREIENDRADIVIGSRYIKGGSAAQGLSRFRLLMSRVATLLGELVMKVRVSDPMSGFFMLRRETFEHQMHKLSGMGFKVLLDLLTSVPGDIRVLEIPYTMRQRQAGDSKLDTLVVTEYYQLLLDKLLGKYIPVRFLMFVSVGFTGVFVHLLTLSLTHKILGLAFVTSQVIGTITAMTTNFLINNRFTYRDMRLTGLGFVYGLLSFYLACGIGAVINVQLSEFMFENGANWLVAGVTGAFVGAVWNYSMTATITWRKQRR